MQDPDVGVVVELDAASQNRMILRRRLNRDHRSGVTGQPRCQQREVAPLVRTDVDESHAGPQIAPNQRMLGGLVGAHRALNHRGRFSDRRSRPSGRRSAPDPR